jgi:hypothetical protein
MKAIAYYASLPITDPNALQDIELPPSPVRATCWWKSKPSRSTR